MSRRVAIAALSMLGLALSPGANAAKVRGRVLDVNAGSVLESEVRVVAARCDETGVCEPVKEAFIPRGGSEFTFDHLREGTYLISARGPNYLAGGYPTDVVLSERGVTALGPIVLQPRPLRLRNVRLSSDYIPAAGGSIELTVDVVNETDVARENLRIAVNWWVTKVFGSSGQAGTLVVEAIEPKKLKVDARSVNTISVPLTLPKAAPNYPQVIYAVSVNLVNRTKFSAVTDRIEAGNVFKGDENCCTAQRTKASALVVDGQASPDLRKRR